MTFTPKFADLVRNVATVEGTGPVTLGPAVAGFDSLSDAVSPGEQFYYCIQGIDRPQEREVGRGTMQADGKVSRDPVGEAATDFSSGAKTIALVAPAEWYAKLEGVSGELETVSSGALRTRSALEVETSLAVGENSSVAGDLSVDGTLYANGNLTVGGAFNAVNATAAFGPQSGIASDCNLYIDNTNYNGFLYFRSWRNGLPQVDGWVRARRGAGLEIDGQAGIGLQCAGNTILSITDTSIELAAGKVLKVGGIRVVGSQQSAIADDMSGATNQIVVNAILNALRNHGLIAT